MATDSSSIQFEEDTNGNAPKKRILYSRIVSSNVPPKIVRLLISRHIVKNERQANMLLLALFFVCMVASAIILLGSSDSTHSDITKEAVIRTIISGH